MKTRWQWAQKIELFWWKRYLHKKPVGAYLEWKLTYWQKTIKSLAPELVLRKDMKILDAGCGPAGTFIALGDQHVTAVDPLLNSYQEQIQHFKKENYPNVRFVNKALEEFNEPNSYDVVFCMNAINHVRHLKQALQHTVNAAKPHGWVIVSVDAHNFKWAKFIFKLLPGDVLHPHQHSLVEYADMLKQCGCSIEKRIFVKKEFWFNHYILVGKKT
jgi:2-polyprenyl-6-hydroxyphenyl methylase/3-demethylubiquinone-9 3-methyltransferase